jgi:hypothetical protein
MRIRSLLLGAVFLVFTMFAETAVFAQGASAFQGLTSSDAAHLVQAGFGIYNTDTTASHSITAFYGIVTPIIANTSVSFTAYVYNDGAGTTSCNAYSLDLNNGLASTTGSTQGVSGSGSTTISFNVGTATESHSYVVSVVCTLSKSQGGGNNSTLFVVVSPD